MFLLSLKFSDWKEQIQMPRCLYADAENCLITFCYNNQEKNSDSNLYNYCKFNEELDRSIRTDVCFSNYRNLYLVVNVLITCVYGL